MHECACGHACVCLHGRPNYAWLLQQVGMQRCALNGPACIKCDLDELAKSGRVVVELRACVSERFKYWCGFNHTLLDVCIHTLYVRLNWKALPYFTSNFIFCSYAQLLMLFKVVCICFCLFLFELFCLFLFSFCLLPSDLATIAAKYCNRNFVVSVLEKL